MAGRRVEGERKMGERTGDGGEKRKAVYTQTHKCCKALSSVNPSIQYVRILHYCIHVHVRFLVMSMLIFRANRGTFSIYMRE